MRVQLAFPLFRAFDSDGVPLVGGKLYTYDTGTTTPRATYDNDGTTNTNPVILDGDGEAEVWLDNGLYRLVLYDSDDVLQWTIDSVTGIVAPATAAETKTGTDDTIAITPAGLTLEVIDDRAFGVDAEADDDYAITLSPAPAALYIGMTVRFSANTANTGISKLNVNSLGLKRIKKNHDADLEDNDIEAGQIVTVVYDGTYWQMQSQIAIPSSSLISDTAYDESVWDGVTTIAPSKNAVRDKIELMTPLGLVIRPKFIFKDGNELYINAGMYDHDGTTRQSVYWSSQLTFILESGGSNADSHDYGADGWHYIYLDDSAIVTNASPLLDETCFANYTGANAKPVWVDAKHGWYGDGVGDAKTGDRCIFAGYETGGVIIEFFQSGRDVYNADTQIAFAGADPGTTFVDLDLSAFMPGFSIEAILVGTMLYIDAATDAKWRTNGQTGATGHLWGRVTASSDSNRSTFAVITDDSQIIEHMITAGNDTVLLNIEAWKLPIGM